MIYGENFNIIHMPKTGGTWLRRVCEQLPPGYIREIYPNHRPYSELTREEAEKPTYAFVRNPFDWYLSLYGHMNGNLVNQRHEFRLPFDRLPDYHKQDHLRFRGSFVESLEFLIRASNSSKTSETRPCAGWMSEVFDTFTVRQDGLKPIVLKYEDGVREGLRKILEAHTPHVSDEVLRVLRDHQVENVSSRTRDCLSAYPRLLREEIRSRDANIFERFGYLREGS